MNTEEKKKKDREDQVVVEVEAEENEVKKKKEGNTCRKMQSIAAAVQPTKSGSLIAPGPKCTTASVPSC
jgi:hypothetical protein